MQKKVAFPFLILLLVVTNLLKAQKDVTTFGIQFKPIISSEIINTGPQSKEEGNVAFTISPKSGYSFGMVVRKGISKQFSIEGGINFTQRNFDLDINHTLTGFEGNSDFRYIIYEIPLLGLVYVQLGERSYLNNAFGIAMNFLPSDWDSFDDYFEHLSLRRSWFVTSLMANMGFEYRTYDKGIIYAGLSYHRPFSPITDAIVQYQGDFENGEISSFEILGNYLTIDLRYFFNEPPEKRKRK